MYGVIVSVLYTKKFPLLSLRSNLGNNVERVCVLLVNVPVVWVTPDVSVLEYLNSLSFVTSATKNVPLYPLSSNPVELVELCTFLITTWSPIFTLCGLSERIVIKFSVLSKLACDIKRVLRSKA